MNADVGMHHANIIFLAILYFLILFMGFVCAVIHSCGLRCVVEHSPPTLISKMV